MAIKEINRALCDGSGICLDVCPTDVIRLDKEKKAYIAYPEDCCNCYLCEIYCPTRSIKVSAEIGSIKLPF